MPASAHDELQVATVLNFLQEIFATVWRHLQQVSNDTELVKLNVTVLWCPPGFPLKYFTGFVLARHSS